MFNAKTGKEFVYASKQFHDFSSKIPNITISTRKVSNLIKKIKTV